MRLLLAAFAIALSGPPAAAAETPARMVPFDVSRAENWGDALALCDLTAFLRTRPSLDADVVLAADSRSEFARPLYGPRFLPPGLFFDQNVRLTFERLEKAGEVDRRSVGAARARHDRPLFRVYQRGGSEDLAFLEEQSQLCAALILDVRRRYP
jgi:hypothetical protein